MLVRPKACPHFTSDQSREAGKLADAIGERKDVNMDLDGFWKLIDAAAGADARRDALAEQLASLSREDLIAFQAHFDRAFDAAYQWPLWGAAYLMQGGCSDDGFMDFRYGLISLGRSIYEAALAEPDSLASLANGEFADELYGYVALDIYETRFDDDMPRDDVPPLGEPEGIVWDFDDSADNRQHLPRLSAKYG